MGRSHHDVHATSVSARGFFAAINKRVLAAPDGARRPCSHSCSVRTETPSKVANFSWDSPVCSCTRVTDGTFATRPCSPRLIWRMSSKISCRATAASHRGQSKDPRALGRVAGRPEEAVRRFEDSVRTNPQFFNARYYLGVAYLHANRTADAIRELEAAVKLDAQQPQPVAYLVYAHAMNGAPAAARLRFDELTRLSESRYVSRYLFAVANVDCAGTNRRSSR